MSKEKQFWDAARAGDLSLVAADPTLNVNWQGQLGFTTLNVACELGRESVVQFLLMLTTVDVNKPEPNLRRNLRKMTSERSKIVLYCHLD